MRVTLRVSTGAKVDVWRGEEGSELFHAQRLDDSHEPEICLAVDLFEVIADLSDLDLDNTAQSAEATALAERAMRQLAADNAE